MLLFSSFRIEELERVQDQVRGSYHTYRANAQVRSLVFTCYYCVSLSHIRSDSLAHLNQHMRQYQAFDDHVRQMQSTAYDVTQSGVDGSERLVLRVQESYVRSASSLAAMTKCVEAFIAAHRSNVGAHPFLAGLAEVLRWNLESATVVGWQRTLSCRRC